MRLVRDEDSWHLGIGPLHHPIITASDERAVWIAGQLLSRLQPRVGALVHGDGLIRSGPPELRLALEMAAHEDIELEATRGELSNLEQAWREAEEIGRIADDVLIPGHVRARFTGLKRLENHSLKGPAV
jgi:hypothetical protein